MTDICCYEHDRGFVLERFQRGEFDYVDSASEVLETEFLRYIEQKSILEELGESYPSPRKKHDVPVWLYLACNISMRMHGVHAYHAFPYLVRVGGMLTVFGPKVAHKNKYFSLHVITAEGRSNFRRLPIHRPSRSDPIASIM